MTSHKKSAPHIGAKKEPSPQEINVLVALFKQGRYAEIETLARAMTARFPQHGFGWKALGTVLLQQGRTAEALAPLREAAKLAQGDAQLHNNLGNALTKLGRLSEAETSYRQALQVNPGFIEAHYNLGNTLQKPEQLPEAEASYRRALELKPDFAGAHNGLGNTLLKLGRLSEAEASYRRALKIKPDYAEAHYNLGDALITQNRFPEAEVCYRRALELKPDYAEAHCDLGNALNGQGRLSEAEASYRRALELKPNYAGAHGNLGVTLYRQGRLPEAEASLRQALELNPDFADTHSNLGNTLREQGRAKEAEASYRRALEIQPHALQYAIHSHLLLPIIPDTADTITAWRKRFQTGITALMDAPGSLKDPAKELNSLSFYLAYHNHNDRPIMENMRHLFRARVAGLTTTAPHVPFWQSPTSSGKRIRVGFLSKFMVKHTIGKLYQGLIRHLDRNRFEVVVIHAPQAKLDDFSHSIDGLVDKVVILPASLEDQQRAVEAAKLDVLFYPDIGMSPYTYFLGYSRLAPVQAVSWGHPVTTGLDTIDYFVSAANIEPEDAEEHYTERLIRLNRLPCFYQPLIAPCQIPARTELGLPETGSLYGCPQTLFKFHPEFDAVLEAIAEGDPAGHIVLLEGTHPAWTDMLKARWEKSFSVLSDRVLFLPRLPMDRFMAFMAHIDVLLDPIHFGSGNTLYEAMVSGTPIVTWPGKFMRGRIVAGAYRQMGLADAPIAQRLEDYAPLALALGRDPERCQTLRQASRAAADRELFADMKAVREFEAFLEAAVAAAGRGERLPMGWKPDI